MEVLGTAAASLQVIEMAAKVYRRLKNASQAPEHLASLTLDAKSRIAVVENARVQIPPRHHLSYEADHILDDLKKCLALVDLQVSSSKDNNEFQNKFCLKKLRLQWVYLRKQGKIGRIQEEIDERLLWMILGIITDNQAYSLVN
jgi:hypothetical protein